MYENEKEIVRLWRSGRLQSGVIYREQLLVDIEVQG